MIILTESMVAARTYIRITWRHAYINLLTVISHAQQLQSDIVHG